MGFEFNAKRPVFPLRIKRSTRLFPHSVVSKRHTIKRRAYLVSILPMYRSSVEGASVFRESPTSTDVYIDTTKAKLTQTTFQKLLQKCT